MLARGFALGSVGSGWRSHRPGAWQGLGRWGRGAEVPWPWHLAARLGTSVSHQAGGQRVKEAGLKDPTCWESFLQPPEWGRDTLALPLLGAG